MYLLFDNKIKKGNDKIFIPLQLNIVYKYIKVNSFLSLQNTINKAASKTEASFANLSNKPKKHHRG